MWLASSSPTARAGSVPPVQPGGTPGQAELVHEPEYIREYATREIAPVETPLGIHVVNVRAQGLHGKAGAQDLGPRRPLVFCDVTGRLHLPASVACRGDGANGLVLGQLAERAEQPSGHPAPSGNAFVVKDM